MKSTQKLLISIGTITLQARVCKSHSLLKLQARSAHASDVSHCRFDMIADGLQCLPAATSLMLQTFSPVTWFQRAGRDAIFTGRSSLKDKTSGYGEIVLYELTENSKEYKGTLVLSCLNDLWFFKYSIFSPARHNAASAIAVSASIQKNQQQRKFMCLEDKHFDTGCMQRTGFLARIWEWWGIFFGWVREKIARRAILKCGVSCENLKTLH